MLEKQKIIISYYREGKTQRQIKRETGISRKTIRKYLREYEEKKKKLMESGKEKDTEELIADIVEKRWIDTSNRFKLKLTEEVIERIKFYLAQNEKKRSEGRHKQQMKKIDIHEALTEEGYGIGYTTVCNTVRKIEKQKREAFEKRSSMNWGKQQNLTGER